MIVKESDCVGCQLPCIHKSCPHYEVFVFYCDKCKDPVEDLWEFDGEQLCADCIFDSLDKVTIDDYY